MRTILVLIVVVLLMALGGWLTFRQSGDRTTITVETKKLKEDTSEAVEEGKQAIRSASEKAEEELKERAGRRRGD